LKKLIDWISHNLLHDSPRSFIYHQTVIVSNVSLFYDYAGLGLSLGTILLSWLQD